MQSEHKMSEDTLSVTKKELRCHLDELRENLNRYLASGYGIDQSNIPDDRKYEEKFVQWCTNHQPFHWFAEFYGIIKSGGFAVIIGNPPFKLYSTTAVGYMLEPMNFSTFETKNIYAFVFERSISLAAQSSPVALIVQMTFLSSERLHPLQELLTKRGRIYALSFPRRPESMFEGVEMPIAMIFSTMTEQKGFVTSKVGRIYTEERPYVMQLLALSEHSIVLDNHRFAKIGTSCEQEIYKKLTNSEHSIKRLTAIEPKNILYYQEACRYWVKANHGLPFFRRDSLEMPPPHGRTISFKSDMACSFVVCIINSSLFYWLYSSFCDCEHINDKFFKNFPIPTSG
jgi:hypothetical protein